MLVSPTEPRELRAVGTVSAVPEMYGVDYLAFVPGVGKVGVQRKEIGDFVASVRDDRLSTEVAQSRSLDLRMLIVEGTVEWTNDGVLLGPRSGFTRAQYLGILWNLQSEGFWITFTRSTTETTECLLLFTRWVAKEKHSTLTARKKPPRNMYGTRGSEDWQIHVLQSFPGVGYERARAVVEFYGGLPLEWTGTLTDVPGIGPRLSGKLGSLLDKTTERSEVTDGDGNTSGSG